MAIEAKRPRDSGVVGRGPEGESKNRRRKRVNGRHAQVSAPDWQSVVALAQKVGVRLPDKPIKLTRRDFLLGTGLAITALAAGRLGAPAAIQWFEQISDDQGAEKLRGDEILETPELGRLVGVVIRRREDPATSRYTEIIARSVLYNQQRKLGVGQEEAIRNCSRLRLATPQDECGGLACVMSHGDGTLETVYEEQIHVLDQKPHLRWCKAVAAMAHEGVHLAVRPERPFEVREHDYGRLGQVRASRERGFFFVPVGGETLATQQMVRGDLVAGGELGAIVTLEEWHAQWAGARYYAELHSAYRGKIGGREAEESRIYPNFGAYPEFDWTAVGQVYEDEYRTNAQDLWGKAWNASGVDALHYRRDARGFYLGMGQRVLELRRTARTAESSLSEADVAGLGLVCFNSYVMTGADPRREVLGKLMGKEGALEPEDIASGAVALERLITARGIELNRASEIGNGGDHNP